MNEEEKVLDALKELEIKPDHNIDEYEIKKSYLRLAKIYHPDTCSNEIYKDGNKFSSMKESYDYVKNNINLANEVINNTINPNNKTYNYYNSSNSFDNFDYNSFNTSYQNGQTYYYYSYEPNKNGGRYSDKFNPSIITSIFSLFVPFVGIINYFIFGRLFKKNARFYLLLSFIGIILNILPLFL